LSTRLVDAPFNPVNERYMRADMLGRRIGNHRKISRSTFKERERRAFVTLA